MCLGIFCKHLEAEENFAVRQLRWPSAEDGGYKVACFVSA